MKNVKLARPSERGPIGTNSDGRKSFSQCNANVCWFWQVQ